jgi:hypothetical protein
MNDHDVEIILEEVVLDGPFGARSGALREAIAAHLGRIVAERGVPEGGALHLPEVTIDAPLDLGADAVAAKAAGEIYERLAAPAWAGRPGGAR